MYVAMAYIQLCNKKCLFSSDSHDDDDDDYLFAGPCPALSALFLFFISSVWCCCCFHHLFSNCFCFRYPEAEIKILCLRSCLTDPIRILSEEGDGQSKKTMGNCCCLWPSFVFLSPPPSVIRTDHSGWDSLRLLISSFIHSDDRSHFPIIHFHIFSLGITGGPINYRRLKNGSARLFSNHFFCSISKCFSL